MTKYLQLMENGLEASDRVTVGQLTQEQPILPRYPWKNRRSWLKLMIKTKKALVEAEKKVSK
jgi:hypothetical protein